MRELTEYILTRIEPTLHDFELDGYDKTIEHFKRQLEIIVDYYKQKQINVLVNRFLAWKLPGDFNPDGGISFDKNFMICRLTGTNLFNAIQAKAMFEHLLVTEDTKCYLR